MVRALRTHTPAVRSAFGRSLGPMTTSATTPISASSDQLKSSIALHQSETLTLSTAERGSNHETPLRQNDGEREAPVRRRRADNGRKTEPSQRRPEPCRGSHSRPTAAGTGGRRQPFPH